IVETSAAMKDWAVTPDARRAVFFALRILRATLMLNGIFENYDAARDFTLCRPWVIYYAALTVWAYGYLRDKPTGPRGWRDWTRAQQIEETTNYLRMMDVRSPEDLEQVEGKW